MTSPCLPILSDWVTFPYCVFRTTIHPAYFVYICPCAISILEWINIDIYPSHANSSMNNFRALPSVLLKSAFDILSLFIDQKMNGKMAKKWCITIIFSYKLSECIKMRSTDVIWSDIVISPDVCIQLWISRIFIHQLELGARFPLHTCVYSLGCMFNEGLFGGPLGGVN